MFLKQIELENFKSFGKRLTVPLLEGYTAVTGPNGSGKSNISDSILFVLGPKSSRAIRAGKLSDLIFNGGNNKDPADHCKVSLVFDNKDRLISIDNDTVRLTRVVKMSSEGDGYNSYFYVNDRKSSLSEFDSLLANARISADGYNFVQQGDVTRIVSMSNLERRRILDDISGISKYDEEINKAELERAEADANIERISIILTELAGQITQLEKEREVALTYLRMKEMLTQSKAQMAARKKESTESEIQALQGQISTFEGEIEKMKNRKQEIFELVRSLEEKMTQTDRELEAKGGREFKDLREKIDALKIEVAKTQDRAARALQQAEEMESSCSQSADELITTKDELDKLDKDLGTTTNEHSNKTKALDIKKRELTDVQSKISACDVELASLEKRISSDEADLRKAEEAAHHLTMEKERLEDKRTRSATDLGVIDEEMKTLEFGLTDSEWKLKQIKDEDKGSAKELKKLQEDFLLKKGAEARLAGEANELDQAIKRLTREVSRLKAEEEAAGEIAKGYNRAVRAMMDARDTRTVRGIHGTIAELANVDPKYQTALNIAAGNRMQAIVVDDDEVASIAIQFLKKNNLGRATFLPLNKMLDGRPRGKSIMAAKDALGFAMDLVKFDEKYRSAFWYVLGDTVVVETLDQARKLMGGVRLVTLGGELLEASGAMVGGNIESSGLKFGSSARGKLDEVSEQLNKAIRSSEMLAEELRSIRSEVMAIEGKIRELNGVGGASQMTVKVLEDRRDELKNKLRSAKEERDRKQTELSQTEVMMADVSERIVDSGTAVRSAMNKRDEDRAHMEKVAPRELSQRLKQVQTDVIELTNTVSTLRSGKETIETKIKFTQKRADDLLAQEKDLKEKITKLKKESEEASALEARSKIDLAALRKIEDSMGQELNELRLRKESLFRQKTGLENDREKIQSRIETNTEVIISLRTRIVGCQDKVRELDEELKQYNVQLVLPLPSIDGLKDTIRQCEAAISSMGPVNLRAVEDYDERKKRYDELGSETKRLEMQHKELLALESDLNEKKRVCLLKVYQAVNENFRRAYSELSSGGEAELVLENPEQPFEGGLVIKARPKLGKVLRLEALSGGEKSLTALAFIFAIQEYQPSPFYLLDEVDMFLDGVNADMVARRVQKSSKTAQFVQISLRKITLTKADHIIGVTKADGGISHVIVRPNIGDVTDLQSEFKIPDEKTEGGIL